MTKLTVHCLHPANRVAKRKRYFRSMRDYWRLIALVLLCMHSGLAVAQQRAILEGYAFEDNNSGYLNEVKVTVLDAETGMLYGEANTNREGYFAMDVPKDKDFLVRGTKAVFKSVEAGATSKTLTDGKAFVKLALARAPGYLLEVTLAEERRKGQEEVRGINNSLIEVFNNTTSKELLVLRGHQSPYFSFQLEQGNHYTILIRSPGYFTKRIESFVNVDGCILCMDGVSEIGPGVSDNLAYGHEVGTLLANIELKPLRVDSAIELKNIYYDYNSSEIRPDAAYELDKVVELLRVNPSIVVELGSHTDTRGKPTYNRDLSQQRAQAAVDYIEREGITKNRLAARGYGEDKPVNICIQDVECSEEEHAKNRRTELRITGFTSDPFAGKPLAEIIREEHMEALLAEVLKGGEIKIPEKPGSATPGQDADVAEINAGLESLKGDLSKQKPTVNPNSPESVASSDGVHRTPATGIRRPTTVITPGANPAPASEATKPESRSGLASTSAVKPTAPAKQKPISVMVPEQSLTNATPLSLPTGGKFSGYRVLVFQSPMTLADANGELFFKYGTLREEKLADESFGYMSGAFGSEPEARSYLDNVRGLFPGARLLRYVNGFIIENAQ